MGRLGMGIGGRGSIRGSMTTSTGGMGRRATPITTMSRGAADAGGAAGLGGRGCAGAE